MELYYPVKNPINQANLFGANPAEYEPLGQKGHPGIDFESPVGTKIFAPCDGGAFYTTDSDGGCGIWIRTPNNASPLANIILWHMVPKDTEAYPYQIPTDGSVTQVTAGQFLGYSGNSGYPKESTGPHCHIGYMPCDKTSEALEPNNGYKGCEDPTPLFNGKVAEDISTEDAIVQKSAQVVQLISTATNAQISTTDKLTILEKVESFIQSLL